MDGSGGKLSSKKDFEKKRLKKFKYKKDHPQNSHKKRVGAAELSEEDEEPKVEKRLILQDNPTYLMPEDEPLDRGKNFATLMSLPSYKDTQFMLKSDKTWNLDISRYADLFELNLASLNAGVRCIPFLECIDLGEEYLTKDQITKVHNDTEEAKQIYKTYFADKIDKDGEENKQFVKASTSDSSKSEKNVKSNASEEKKSNVEVVEEELDFLLSLNEPVEHNIPAIALDVTASTKDPKTKSKTTETKSIDLEKWLDSVLED